MYTSDSSSEAEFGLVDLSERFLREVRGGELHGPMRDRIAELASPQLASLDRRERLAFWINVYNAAAQATLQGRPARYEHRRRFFSEPLVTVSGTGLSLDEIEHGILRRSRWKYGLGYVPDPFPSSFERRHRLSERDYRIHFALNCGAASCPAIAAYTADSVDEQLDRATESYLNGETVVEDGTIYLPRLLLWFRGDFGGRSGIKRLLREYDLIDPGERPRIRYRKYDWSLALGKYLGREERS